MPVEYFILCIPVAAGNIELKRNDLVSPNGRSFLTYYKKGRIKHKKNDLPQKRFSSLHFHH